MGTTLTLQASAEHIKRAGIAQNKLAELTVSNAKKLVEPHIKKVRKNILAQLKQREIDRKKDKTGSQAVYYKLKEIDQAIKDDWPEITKSVKKVAAKDIKIAAKSGFSVVNAELGTAYRTPLVSAAFAESVDLIVKTAARVHIKVIRAEIVQGMIANDDFARSASRIAQFFDKGKGTGHYKSPFSNAARVIRSETQLAHVRSKVALYENEGYTRVLIVNGKVGCPICASHIGEVYRLDDGPLPIYHPHCGCSTVAYDRKPKPPESQIPENKPIPIERETDFQKAPKPLVFTPAKNVKEAEKFATGTLAKTVNYKGLDVDIANDLNKRLVDLVKKNGIILDDIDSIPRMNKKIGGKVKQKNVVMQFYAESDALTGKVRTQRLMYSPQLMKTRDIVNQTIEKFGERGIINNLTFNGLVDHEFGHFVEFKNPVGKYESLSSKMGKQWRTSFDDFYSRSTVERKLKKEIGNYIFVNDAEMFAENYRLWKSDSLPDELKWFDKFMKTELKTANKK